MKKTSLFIFSLIFAVSCQKRVGVVNDHVGNFDIKWGRDVQIFSDSPKVNLKRQDPNFGPEVEVESFDRFELKSIDKKIQCGSFVAASAQKEVSKPDDMKFKISPQTFPNLVTFPKVNRCTMEIVLTNKTGSTMRKKVEMELDFDGPQLLRYRYFQSQAIEPLKLSAGESIIAEKMIVSNPFNYSIIVGVLPADVKLGFSDQKVSLDRALVERRGAMAEVSLGSLERIVLEPQEKIIIELVFKPKAEAMLLSLFAGGSQLVVWRSLAVEAKTLDAKMLGSEVDVLSPMFSETMHVGGKIVEPLPPNFTGGI